MPSASENSTPLPISSGGVPEQEVLGYDAMVPDLNVNEFADFEYLMRGGPGMLHGGGTLDTDRLIVARRMGLGRATKEQAAVTI